MREVGHSASRRLLDTLEVMPRVTANPDLPAALAPISLAAADGTAVRLGDLWADSTCVLVHLRHFG